jgi:hypothetical protein
MVGAGAGGEVTIAGRAFRLGAVHAPRSSGYFRRPRRLLRHDPDSPLPGGRAKLETVPAGIPHVMAGTEWAAWAGEEVTP